MLYSLTNMAQAVSLRKPLTIPNSFQRIPYPVTLLVVDYLDSLIPISFTCKYFSSNHKIMWKDYCQRFRVISPTFQSPTVDFFFHAEHVLLRKRTFSDIEIREMPIAYPIANCLHYPMESILDALRNGTQFSLNRILIDSSKVKKIHTPLPFYGRVEIGTSRENAIVAKIGTLFTIFLDRGAKISEETIKNLVQFHKGLKILKMVQQICQRRNIRIPSKFFVDTFSLCSSPQLKDYCFSQVPFELKKLDFALSRVSPREFNNLILKGVKPSPSILMQAIFHFSMGEKFFGRENEFVPVLQHLITVGARLARLPDIIFYTEKPHIVLRTLVPQALQNLKTHNIEKERGDYVLQALKILVHRCQPNITSKVIKYLVRYGAIVTINAIKDAIKYYSYYLPPFDLLFLICEWDKQNARMPFWQNDLFKIMRHSVERLSDFSSAKMIFGRCIFMLKREVPLSQIRELVINHMKYHEASIENFERMDDLLKEFNL